MERTIEFKKDKFTLFVSDLDQQQDACFEICDDDAPGNGTATYWLDKTNLEALQDHIGYLLKQFE